MRGTLRDGALLLKKVHYHTAPKMDRLLQPEEGFEHERVKNIREGRGEHGQQVGGDGVLSERSATLARTHELNNLITS